MASSIEALLFSSSVITLLGDAKDATRVAARALLVQASITALIFDAHSATLATHIYADVETFIKDHVLLSKNARTREQVINQRVKRLFLDCLCTGSAVFGRTKTIIPDLAVQVLDSNAGDPTDRRGWTCPRGR